MRDEKTQKLTEDHFIRHKIFHEKRSGYKIYAELTIGNFSVWKLIKYEFINTVFGPIPGALGIFLRKLIYPKLFSHIGKGVIFGRNIVIRHAENIRIGNGVIIDDYALIDARGAGEKGISIGDNVIINRDVMILSKVGPIVIGPDTNVGAKSCITSQGEGIFIGEKVSIAGGCYISGGAFKATQDINVREDRYSKGPIRIDDNCRLAMGSMVLDNVHIQEGCIVGAGSVVMNNLQKHSVAIGVPARVWRTSENS